MKKAILFTFVLIFFCFQSFSQLLSWSPDFIQEGSTPVVITMDATKGNQGLLNYTPTSDVYVHIGVITNLSTSSSDWKYVNSVWGTTNPTFQATYLGSNKWSYTITGGLRTFFGMSNPAETIQKIAILFRSGNGSLVQRNIDASDMFIPVYTTTLAVRFTKPLFQPTAVRVPEEIIKNIGDNISLTASGNNVSNMTLYLNGTVIQSVSAANSISANPLLSKAGNQIVVAEANDGTTDARDTFSFFVPPSLPNGLKEGINYESGDTSVTLVLYAPSKTSVSVVGDFPGSNWTVQPQYQMINTTDGFYWTLRIKGLTSGTEYAYQYLIDDSIQVADYNTEKVLDKNVDPDISSSTYPGLKTFPAQAVGTLASIVQTGQTPYNWQVTNFSKPDKRNLVIYELLVRDFLATGNWQTLTDTLNYLKKLGINAIEVMPFNNFEGASSWGYNPNFYFAPDKVYGTETALKQFIDACHQNGMAVIMDMVLNHSFGSSPMVQMYFDKANNIPAANNPWFSQYYTHAYDVGYQFNNATVATKEFRKRVIAYWLQNYHIDGYRFDLAKGFTPNNTCDATGNNCNVTTWGNYDVQRINIWDTLYNYQQSVAPGSYTILEMFSDNNEEQVYSASGMMSWGNMNYNFNQATMGYNTGWDFSGGIYTNRGFPNPTLVTYQESHDEERLMWQNEQYGNSTGTYNIKDTATGLNRNAMAAAFWALIPGPKMLWQFGELGYDYSINTCADGVTVNNNCRLDTKPIKWNYLQNANRKSLHDIYSGLLKLRTRPAYLSTFTTGTISYDLSGAFKWMEVYDNSLKVVLMGNFDVVPQTSSVTFPSAGTWTDYLNGAQITATGASQSFTLQPGEYHVYLNADIVLPVTLVSFTGKNSGNTNVISWKVDNENDLNYYELQQSIDGQKFSPLTQIKATGNGNYSYADDISSAASLVYYYRLKMADKDGNFKYSPVVKINIHGKGKFASVNPNPFKQKLEVSIESLVPDKATLIINDIDGRQLYKQIKNVTAGTNVIEINEAGRFSKGTYLLTIIESQQIQSIKIVKGN
ncbi:MAG TPA: alpha-amylase family glycosyl hydrolase [Ginsengibacter sp.]